jgi:hypothetical protein
MIIRLIALALFSVLGGCANGIHPLHGLGLNTDDAAFRKIYDDAVVQYERQAEQREITWAEAAVKIRATDFGLAEEARRFDTSWKFDSYDEEYHSYCIAIAEKVDGKQISIAQYRASRIAKLNEVNARILSLSAQQQQLLNQQQIINNTRQRFQPLPTQKSCLTTKNGASYYTTCE